MLLSGKVKKKNKTVRIFYKYKQTVVHSKEKQHRNMLQAKQRALH